MRCSPAGASRWRSIMRKRSLLREMVRPSTGALRAPAQGEDKWFMAFRKNLILSAREARSQRTHNGRPAPQPNSFVSSKKCGRVNSRSGGNEAMRCIRTGGALAVLAVLCLGMLAGPAESAEPYQINAILPLSGGGSFLGKAEQKSLELAAALANKSGGINGRPLQFVFHDDQSSPQTAVQLATEIVAQHPPLLIGSSIVAMCNAMAPLMRNGPVQYCLSPGIHPQAGSYTFTASVSTFDLANALIRYFRMKGWTRIALMTSTDASGQDAERGLNQIIAMPENKDVTVVERAHFNPTDVSVAAQIERVKAANPQAFIAWSTGAPIATIFRAINQAGLDIPIGTTDGNMTHAQMDQYDAFLPPQLYFPAALWAVAVER